MSGTLPSTVAGSSRKKRAAMACTACHARKVRCTMVSSGRPCVNCEHDQIECVLHVSARGKHKRLRRTRECDDDQRLDSTSNESARRVSEPVAVREASGAISSSEPSSSFPGNPQLATPSEPPSNMAEDFESNVAGFRNLVEPSPGHRGAETPFYVGEVQSIRFIFNAVKDDHLASCAHFMVPPPNRASLPAEDYAFLRAKGAFDIQSDQLRGELVSLYFDHVHPILPVIDPYDFFRQYDLQGPSRVSPLLLQSMFLVASSYISPEGLQRSGAPSIIALKKQYYLRAKSLYDFDYEADRTCLVQSLLLMGYWYGNTHDRADSWHWIGVAISLSQSLGFHRDPGRSNIPLPQRRLWRRIWWCCFYRDRYVALGMGRPARIGLEDCDVPELVLDDLVSHFSLSEVSATAAATIQRCDQRSPIFLHLLKLSQIMGNVLARRYSPLQRESSSAEMSQKLDAELQTCYLNMDPVPRVDEWSLGTNGRPSSEVVHSHFLHITYHLIIISLFKPLIFDKRQHQRDSDSISSSTVAWNRCLSSASATMELLTTLAENNMIGYLPPESATILISVVSILFLDRLWATGLKRHLATQKTDLAMLILRELERKYLAARFIATYYTAAFQRILREAAHCASRIVAPPWTASSSPPLGNGGSGVAADDASWTLPWASAEHDPVTMTTDWPSQDFLFPDLDTFWDNPLTAGLDQDLSGHLSAGG